LDRRRQSGVALESDRRAGPIEGRPKHPELNWAVTGVYFQDEDVVKIAANIWPSARGAREITKVNKISLECSALTVECAGRGFTRLDKGTPESSLEAYDAVCSLEKRQDSRANCPEEIAFTNGWIDAARKLAERSGKSAYGGYLRRLAEEA
jgi:glucose-1-phosphate thymidylyltransferase